MSTPFLPLAASSQAQAMAVHPMEWVALAILVVGLVMMDLFGHARKPHEPTMKESIIWLVFYVALAVAFGVYVIFKHSSEFSVEFFSAYFTEYSLSIDNIFIFIIIIASFMVPRAFQQKVLLYGIVIALVLRLIFILLGTTLLEHFSWVFFIFGAFLLWTAVSQIRSGMHQDDAEDHEEYKPNALVRLSKRLFNVTEGFVGDKLVVRRKSTTYITPMLLCIISIGSADLMFALDSIPASFGLTTQPLIIFAANAFALLGLRQLFFLVDGLLEKLVFLNFGLGIILGFIGLKLLVEASHGQGWLLGLPEVPPLASLGIILAVLVITFVSSMWYAKKHPTSAAHDE
ncbi:MAG: TerC/Alx family metal homeostasis membrane protein [Actinomycetaceae bacterium]|nr:TerC/Alx family metal homeostasis membrane protein [Actinomycetaceae bacterium]